MAQNAKRSAEVAFSGSQENEQRTKRRQRPNKQKVTTGENASTINTVKSSNKSTAQTSTDKAKALKPVSTPSKSKNDKIPPSSTIKVDASVKTKSKPALPSSSDPDAGKELVLTKKHKKKNKRKKDKTPAQQFGHGDDWRMSGTSGGIFINHDPVLTPDGQYLILATRSEIQIYSASTSLLIRSILIHDNGAITGYAISMTNPTEILVGTMAGFVAKYNINTGSKVGHWNCPRGLSCLSPMSIKTHGEAILAVYSDDDQGDVLRMIPLTKDVSKPESIVILKRNSLQKAMSVTSDGSIIVTFGKDRIYIGQTASPEGSGPSKPKYTWREIATSGRIISFDCRTVAVEGKQNKRLPLLDVVLGLQNGAIMVYDNLLTKLSSKDKGDQNVYMQGRRLHWHRSAVRSVKWSRDGNYIISGGDESVLVIWQLDTNQKQYLPHLSTAILNITVSHSGSHYAVRLADNSVMVLATADLTPSTNVTGLSLGANQDLRNTILLHPQQPNQLVAAVPAHAVGTRSSNATHIQTYDIATNLQLAKQAVTRNLTTAVNVGPEGQLLQEPNIVFAQLSQNADWLVTVDQWCSDPLDAQALELKSETTKGTAAVHETVLRFWNRLEDNTWEPTTRVDEPHTPSAQSILAIAFNPSALELATIGADGYLKFWTPRARVRDGVAITTKSGDPLYSWSNTRQFQIETTVKNPTKDRASAALAYSEDGSILAASWSSITSSQRLVHLIEPKSGTISTSQPHLLTHGPSLLTIMGRYLIAVSDNLVVFDTVTLQPRFNLTLDKEYNSTTEVITHNKFLAASKNSNLFAIGLNPVGSNKSSPGHVVLFNIDELDQGSKAEFDISGQIRALLAEPSGLGFVVIDYDSRIRKLTAPGSVNKSAMALIAQPDLSMQLVRTENKKNIENVFGANKERSNDETTQLLLEQAEAVQARSQSLDDLFGAATTTQVPAVEEMFLRVARAVGSVSVGA